MREDEEEHEPQPGCGGEAAGQAAANCAAVCCCCPMTLLEVVLLVAVRLPTDLIRRVRRRSRSRASPSGSAKAMIVTASPMDMGGTTRGEADAASELEREIMSSRLYGAGFWRSASSGSGSAATSRCSSARR